MGANSAWSAQGVSWERFLRKMGLAIIIIVNQNKIRMVKTVENYMILQALGQGNFAKVYKGKHTKTGQEFAIKVIPSEKFKDIPKLEECTVNEINILSQIRNQSDYIVNYIDMLKTSNNFYFVYEFCNGGTLDKMIQKEGHFSEPKAIKFLKQILEGFKVLSRHNIMHRDLKPENILIHNGHLKIADFSFCKLLENKNDLTQTMLGSPIYMAPEVLKGQIYTMKADIWSMGIVLYKMLFGKCPYQSKSIALLIKLLQKQDLEFPPEPKVSPVVEQFLAKVLVKDPNSRVGWDDIFNTYLITDQGDLINRKDLVLQQQQQAQLRLSSKINGPIPINGNPSYGASMRIPNQSISNPSIGFHGCPQVNGMNGYNNLSSMNHLNMVSPKAGTIFQPTNPGTAVLNRTFESNYDQLSSPTLDKNLITKKSPFKFQQQRSTVDFRSSTNFSNASNSGQSNYNLKTNSDIIQPTNYFQVQSAASTNSQIHRMSCQNPIGTETSGIRAPDPKNDRLALTRTQILIKNHLKCIQINQMALEIFSLGQEYSNYICYFLFKNVSRQIEVLHENLKKQSMNDAGWREFRSLVETELNNLGSLATSFYQAIAEEDRQAKVLTQKSNRSLDEQLVQSKQKILKLYIQNLNDSDEHIRLASQVVDYLVENILIKREGYERMSREHLYKQMKNKVSKE